MLTQKVSTIDELLQFVSTLRQKHGVRLWFRGEENADLTLIPSIQRSQKRLDSERYIANDFYIRARQILDNPPDTDACVWVLTPGLLNEKEGFGNCIYPIDADTTQEMLLPAFKHNHPNPELKNKILACSSTENNLRMYSQYSNFTVHNSLERLEDICDENMLYKIIIPSGRKQYFIESLRVFGISESFVYPDLDHISSDLKDSYGI